MKFFHHYLADIFNSFTIAEPTEVVSHISRDPYFLPILMFPEQQPGNGTAIVQFTADPFTTEYVIQPCVIRYYLAFTPETFNSLYNDGNELIIFFLNIICIPFIKVRIFYFPSIVRKGDKPSPNEMANTLQLRFASELGVLAILGKANTKEKVD